MLTKVDKIDVALSTAPEKMFDSAAVEKARGRVAETCGYNVNRVHPVKLYSSESDRNKHMECSLLLALSPALTAGSDYYQSLVDEDEERKSDGSSSSTDSTYDESGSDIPKARKKSKKRTDKVTKSKKIASEYDKASSDIVLADLTNEMRRSQINYESDN